MFQKLLNRCWLMKNGKRGFFLLCKIYYKILKDEEWMAEKLIKCCFSFASLNPPRLKYFYKGLYFFANIFFLQNKPHYTFFYRSCEKIIPPLDPLTKIEKISYRVSLEFLITPPIGFLPFVRSNFNNACYYKITLIRFSLYFLTIG